MNRVKTTSVKFYYNGLRLNGSKKLLPVYYSLDNHRGVDGRSVSISARDGERLPRDIFVVENNTDLYTDYFDSDRTTLLEAHPLYKFARYAAECSEIRKLKSYSERLRKNIEEKPAFYAKDDFYKKELVQKLEKIAELERHINPGQPMPADLSAVGEMRTAAESARLEREKAEEQERREKALRDLSEDRRVIAEQREKFPTGDYGAPIVTVEWSENRALSDIKGEPMSCAASDAIFSSLNKKYDAEGGYYKTKFIINYPAEDGTTAEYIGRYDIGAESGGLLEHLKSFAEASDTDDAEEHERQRFIDLVDAAINPHPADDGKIIKLNIAPWVPEYARQKEEREAERVKSELKYAQDLLNSLTTEQLAEGIRRAANKQIAIPFLLSLMGRDVLKGLEMARFIEEKFENN